MHSAAIVFHIYETNNFIFRTNLVSMATDKNNNKKGGSETTAAHPAAVCSTSAATAMGPYLL
jgi:hypothetical protein